MRSKMSETCKQLLVGIVIIDVLFTIVGGFIAYQLTGKWLQFILGVFLGGIVAMILAKHMDNSIQATLDLDSDGANQYTKKMAAMRLIVMIVAIVFALTFPSVFNIVGVLLGILALKFSAYVQPLTSKYISNKNE